MAANHLIVALFPIDPLVPFVKIKLAAFATFVQRVRQAAAVLVGFHLFKNLGELAADAVGVLPQDALGGITQVHDLDRFWFGQWEPSGNALGCSIATGMSSAGIIFSIAALGSNPGASTLRITVRTSDGSGS